MSIIRIHPDDMVAVAITELQTGQPYHVGSFECIPRETIMSGHKIALVPIRKDTMIIKYGFPIGRATSDIEAGDWVHTHNMATNLEGVLEYAYTPKLKEVQPVDDEMIFKGFVWENGEVGIRNEIWIIPTVSCINNTAKLLAQKMSAELPENSSVEGVYTFTHPYGCSQLGDDHLRTQKFLSGLVNHPNAGGVLVLSLGCEDNNIPEFQKILGEVNPQRVKFLITQEHDNELEAGMQELRNLAEYAGQFQRQPVPVSRLKVGLKCGGSDGFSGITANPVVGYCSDMLVARGAATMLTEVPEMFGAETLLMERCVNQEIFEKTVNMINGFKEYFLSHDQPIDENPAPGNRAGGITTLEEKSLGCTQKGGSSPVIDIVDYAETPQKSGLHLATGPGNDAVSITVLTVDGSHLILFATGRGNPLGSPAPTIKISSNTPLVERKPHWIDFNAGEVVYGKSIAELGEDLFRYVIEVASGRTLTNNERYNYREIAIFKDGVTV